MRISYKTDRVRSYIVKGYCAMVFGAFILSLLLYVIGQPQLGFDLMSRMFPWLVRSAIVVACFLSVSGLKESI
jgi:ABC-type multidrug transport system permease subunit